MEKDTHEIMSQDIPSISDIYFNGIKEEKYDVNIKQEPDIDCLDSYELGPASIEALQEQTEIKFDIEQKVKIEEGSVKDVDYDEGKVKIEKVEGDDSVKEIDNTLGQLICEELTIKDEEGMDQRILEEIDCESRAGSTETQIVTTTKMYKGSNNALTYSNYELHVCTICSKSFIQKEHMDNHIVNNHSDNNIHECKRCSYKCTSILTLKKHNRLKHKNKNMQKFKCDHCVFSTYYKYAIQRHLVTHSNGNGKFNCTICNKYFVQKVSLDVHIANKHSDNKNLMATITYKLHECQQCSSRFQSVANLKSHLFSHKEANLDLKKYICEICSKHFNRKVALDVHIVNIHPDNKTVMATITHKVQECQQCSFKCESSYGLKIHMLKHKEFVTTVFPKNTCPYCSYTTYNKHHFKKHLAIHVDIKPFVCTKCNKCFKFKPQLYSHILLHHYDDKNLVGTITHKIYECQECSYKTMKITNFKVHVERVHKHLYND